MPTSVWSRLTPAQRRFLLVDNGVGAFVCNFLINGVLAWLMFRSLEQVPLWGQKSVAADTLSTIFMLVLITCLIVTPITRAQIRAGRVQSFQRGAAWKWLPANSIARGALAGCLVFLALAPLSLAALRLWANDGLAFSHFVFFKAVFTAVEGALVTPFLALFALSDAGKLAVTNPSAKSPLEVRS